MNRATRQYVSSEGNKLSQVPKIPFSALLSKSFSHNIRWISYLQRFQHNYTKILASFNLEDELENKTLVKSKNGNLIEELIVVRGWWDKWGQVMQKFYEKFANINFVGVCAQNNNSTI